MESVVEKSAALTAQLKQAYVDVIGLLFDGVIQVAPDQITHQVMVDVDTMLKEIAKCSKAITELSYQVIFDNIIKRSVGEIVTGLLKDFLGNEKLNDALEEWIMKLASIRQFSPCLNGARVNWKSRVQLDLLEI